jgi:CIC family chloride channel protein
MSGNFGLTVAVMLAVVAAVGVSRKLTYGTIYTTKLLRRGIDIDRPRPANLLQVLTAGDVMQPLRRNPRPSLSLTGTQPEQGIYEASASLGSVIETHAPQAVAVGETLEQALRQLALYGPNGLPVLDADRIRIVGWVTREDVVDAIAERLEAAEHEALLGMNAAEWATNPPAAGMRDAPNVLDGYAVVEVAVSEASLSDHRAPHHLAMPEGWILAAVRPSTERRTVVPGRADELQPGDRIILLAPSPKSESGSPTPTTATERSANETV